MPARTAVTFFLAGDVMTGRGIDQVLPHPSEPQLLEPYVKDARDYVRLAERESGPIPRPVAFSYPWGDALSELERRMPDARIVNLETSVTQSNDYWPGKGIHYRMQPKNMPCLTAAGLSCCALANNHVLDFGPAGLLETLDSLRAAGIRTAGAGRDRREAERPAVIALGSGGRILVFSFGVPSSGIPSSWAASEHGPGIALLRDLSSKTLDRVAEHVRALRRAGDIVVASLHWGGNWGYELRPDHVAFARGLVRAGVDVVHGHSSHHPRPIEVFQDKLILHGCGDFLTDYEGIGGYEHYRSDLVLMYFPELSADGRLEALRMVPLRLWRFRLRRASSDEADWVAARLDTESRALGCRVARSSDGQELVLERSRS